MATCDLSVVLDEPNRTFEPGERVTGQVIVDVDKAVRCDGLTVTHQWKTHGRGNTERGAAGAETLFQGEWEPGRYEYTFDFAQPSGPETYHGHNLNVDWYVHVEADIPWALDPDAEVDHLTRYTGPRNDYRVGNLNTVENAGKQQQGCGGCLAIFGGVFFAAALLTLTVAWSGGGGFEGLFVGLVLLVSGGVMIWAGVAKHLAREKLGNVLVELVPTHVHPGEDICCVVSITPPKVVELDRIRYTMKGEEVVTRGSGTNERTYTHELHEQVEVDLLGSKSLQPGVEHTFEQVFTIPKDAPPSFDSGDDNRLEWSIQTEIDIPRWPDWSAKNVMIVVPGDAGEAGETEPPQTATPEAEKGWW